MDLKKKSVAIISRDVDLRGDLANLLYQFGMIVYGLDAEEDLAILR